ncbi:Pectin lyase fold/virulence factor [Arabidopsis thaliana x Arabidopsis arenosa]|uniref:Pectin lyase fold/virulence factor n=1 Tax=Arabidopsis thaliana x Arabidopsis arenosa TaxID=1240361 RepID=A0A8T2BHI6_9BRAS|nr:Pectin lyase fold/virulence factor [Arabidopsis thaliana x Arabidopsis arenosa]
MTSLPYADADCSLRALAGRAEGFGRFSVGGLHGDLYVVTSLADDGPGTLREGGRSKEPLWIVFAVSGAISLNSYLSVSSYKTIDGRGQRIKLTGKGIRLKECEHIIICNLEFEAITEYMQSCHLEKLNVEKRNVHLYRWKKRLGFDIVTLKNGSQATDSAKVYIYDWNMEDVVIGEGRLSSTDPKDLVNNLPIGQGAAIVTVDKVLMENVHLWRPISAEILTIGHNASKIMVEVVKIGEAKVWKPNSEVEIIADAIGTTVAWPNDKLVLWSYVQRFVLASYPKLGENKAKAAPKCNVTIEDDIRE